VTAVPANGSSFDGWSGAAWLRQKRQDYISGNTLVTATFDIIPRYTSRLARGNRDRHRRVSPLAASYTNGSVVTLTAVPADGSTFAGWSGPPPVPPKHQD